MFSGFTQQNATFLDFDGTLVEFAPHPEAVEVSTQLRILLRQLLLCSKGAVALVSGRSITSIDNLLCMPDIPVAGSHGAEWRLPGGERGSIALACDDFIIAGEILTSYSSRHSLIMENKQHSIALHFRQQPHLRAEIDHFLEEHIAPLKGLRTIYGNCVREIHPLGVDKGVAVARFMGMEPFMGRVPSYIGDDTTDEDAFAWVNAHGGLTYKVGAGTTCAQYRLQNVDAVKVFLRRLVEEGER